MNFSSPSSTLVWDQLRSLSPLLWLWHNQLSPSSSLLSEKFAAPSSCDDDDDGHGKRKKKLTGGEVVVVIIICLLIFAFLWYYFKLVINKGCLVKHPVLFMIGLIFFWPLALGLLWWDVDKNKVCQAITV